MKVERVRPPIPRVELLLRPNDSDKVGGLPAVDELLAVEVVDRPLELQQQQPAERDPPRQR